MKTAILALLVAACWGQDANPICGMDSVDHTPNITLLHVLCVDYDALKKHIPLITASGKETQVIVHARAGDTVAVTVGGLTKLAPLMRDGWGRLMALVTFPGAEYTSIAVRVFTEVK